MSNDFRGACLLAYVLTAVFYIYYATYMRMCAINVTCSANRKPQANHTETNFAPDIARKTEISSHLELIVTVFVAYSLQEAQIPTSQSSVPVKELYL